MKRPREDELPPYDDDDAHRREVVCRLNGIPAAFIAAMDKLDAKADPEAIAGAVFTAYREAALDAAARHQEAPHRPAARAEVKAEIKALEGMRVSLLDLCEARGGDYSVGRRAGLIERRVGAATADRRLDAASQLEALDADLAAARAEADALDGRGDGRTTRLRLFAERLVRIYVYATGNPVRSKSSAYDDVGALIGFAAFLAAACNLVTGVVPARSLVENVAKELAKK